MKQNDQPIEVNSEELENAFTEIFNRPKAPQTIIESGTFRGLGSTQTILRGWEKSRQPKIEFWTIEANRQAYEEAVENLKPWPFVKVFHGLSLDRILAETWIKGDAFLRQWDEYPDIYIDFNRDVDPAAYYLTEISRGVTGPCEDDLLKTLIKKTGNKRLMFFLDSAGGCGRLETMCVNTDMKGRRYILGFDDSNHVKHARCAWEIKENEDGKWKILFEDGRVMIAERLNK